MKRRITALLAAAAAIILPVALAPSAMAGNITTVINNTSVNTGIHLAGRSIPPWYNQILAAHTQRTYPAGAPGNADGLFVGPGYVLNYTLFYPTNGWKGTNYRVNGNCGKIPGTFRSLPGWHITRLNSIVRDTRCY